jgi:hypothetical protein
MGCSFPFILCSLGKLINEWFLDSERNLATAIVCSTLIIGAVFDYSLMIFMFPANFEEMLIADDNLKPNLISSL